MSCRAARGLPFLVGLVLLAAYGCAPGGPATADGTPGPGAAVAATGIPASTDGASPTPSASGASGSPSAAPSARRPRVGQCYELSFEEVLARTSQAPPVPCGERTTARTYAVGTLDLLVDGHLLVVRADRVQEHLARTCRRRLADYLGGTRRELRLSMLQAVWFSPTRQQADAGAHWYRCDVVALAGPQRLARLPHPVRGILDHERRARTYALCSTGDPSKKSSHRVPCGAPHQWRAISTVDIPGETYPGRKEARAGQSACKQAAREQADSPLEFTYSYSYPTREQWQSGQHYGICWVPARGGSS